MNYIISIREMLELDVCTAARENQSAFLLILTSVSASTFESCDIDLNPYFRIDCFRILTVMNCVSFKPLTANYHYTKYLSVPMRPYFIFYSQARSSTVLLFLVNSKYKNGILLDL